MNEMETLTLEQSLSNELTLDQILEKEHFILADTSIEGSRTFFEEIYDHNYYNRLELESLL